MESLQDVELSIRILKEFKKAYVNRVLVNVYLTEESIMRNNPRNFLGKKRIINKHKDIIPKKDLSNYYFKIGFSYAENGYKVKGIKNFCYSIKNDFSNYRPYIGLLGLISGTPFYKISKNYYFKIKKFIINIINNKGDR